MVLLLLPRPLSCTHSISLQSIPQSDGMSDYWGKSVSGGLLLCKYRRMHLITHQYTVYIYMGHNHSTTILYLYYISIHVLITQNTTQSYKKLCMYIAIECRPYITIQFRLYYCITMPWGRFLCRCNNMHMQQHMQQDDV